VVEARCDACGTVTYRFVDANYDHRTYSRARDPRARDPRARDPRARDPRARVVPDDPASPP
jgi:hypothetical protein